jgi:coproporphyrinogen III oxidase
MTIVLAPNDFIATRAVSGRELASELVVSVHDRLTDVFATLDGAGTFQEERWARVGGGGGVSRLLVDGGVFEKAGINRSVVEGVLPTDAAARLGGRVPPNGPALFFAAGVSLVIHPRNPHVPTLHLNVRYFEIADEGGEVYDAWVGGGTDLTPTFPHPADARHFHRAVRAVCDAHHESLYPRFKHWCDDYFVNRHRSGEARGVGGIFFDHLRLHDDASNAGLAERFAFLRDVGLSPVKAYVPIVMRRRDSESGAAERALQLARRGRYVEFNLLHDRGTLFGLQTGARIESVLMSLPPVAAWPGGTALGGRDLDRYERLAERLGAMLVPRDWASDAD